VDGVRGELRDEDVVVDGVADGTADDPDGEGQCRYGGDEIVGANDGGDDGRWDDDSADTETTDDEKRPRDVDVFAGQTCHGASACCHEDAAHDHQFLVSSSED